jgi:hypothetical protein
MVSECKWQWVSNHFGPMGWFTDEQKAEHESKFTDGWWRPLSVEEVARMSAAIGGLAYEQS